MRKRLRGWRPHGRLAFLAAAILVLAAGCAANTTLADRRGGATFIYKPAGPAAGARMAPVKVAVLAFSDGTADFKQSGSIFGHGQFNLAKTGISGITEALTPELWAKSFADDLAASGLFRSAVFRYGASELVDEEFVVEGALKKAYGAISLEDLNELAFAVKVVRRADGRPLREIEVARTYRTEPGIVKGCGASMSCVRERCHADLNARMAEMFAEARAGLVAAVRSGSEGASEDDALRDVISATGEPVAASTQEPATPASDSAEQTIERILKGQ